MVQLADVLADLTDESADLDRLVANLAPGDWARETPAVGWTISHQIAHLAWTDHASVLAIRDPQAFTAQLGVALVEPESFVDRGSAEFLDEAPALLHRWREGRVALVGALLTLPAGERIPWYGTAMSSVSMASARIMETWAHGLDVADALGVTREPTARLRHIAHLGHRTLGHGFMVHGRPAPTVPVYLQLAAPDGGVWSFGPADAADRVAGPAVDFCLLVTQRRHRADLALVATGQVADEWLDVAQVFAGPPGAGRQPTGAGRQPTGGAP
jgi:uncharacterized protein (TIGR03084 family)